MSDQKPRENPAFRSKPGNTALGLLWLFGLLWFLAGLGWLVYYITTGDSAMAELWGPS
jgi:hypothetical protein